MLLVSTTMFKRIRLLALLMACLIFRVQAQNLNSPYSRYGLGDIVPSQNILTRGMGGIGAAYYDYSTVNFLNPASYARLQATTLDIGVELATRSLRAVDPPRKFSAYSPQISYVQLGVPLKKTGGWGMNIGLRPITRINYKIEQIERLPGIDSIRTLYEGSGGTYEAFVGTGFTLFKNLSLGVNVGYMFGSKDYSTRRIFLNDSIFYYPSNYETKANYGGLMFNGGIQYTAKLSKKSWLRFGAHGNLQQTFNATRDYIKETFRYEQSGSTTTIDTVEFVQDASGDVKYPMSWGAGIIYDKLGKWMIGADYNTTKWSEYRFFNEADEVRDSYTFHLGAQLLPKGGKSYWNNVSYRIGFSTGKDYISVDRDLPRWSASLGIGLPMRKPAYSNQFSVINTTFEIGTRGDKNSAVRETFFQLAFGLSLSDIWFIKRKYD
jgi:hypothetical protein